MTFCIQPKLIPRRKAQETSSNHVTRSQVDYTKIYTALTWQILNETDIVSWWLLFPSVLILQNNYHSAYDVSCLATEYLWTIYMQPPHTIYFAQTYHFHYTQCSHYTRDQTNTIFQELSSLCFCWQSSACKAEWLRLQRTYHDILDHQW